MSLTEVFCSFNCSNTLDYTTPIQHSCLKGQSGRGYRKALTSIRFKCGFFLVLQVSPALSAAAFPVP